MIRNEMSEIIDAVIIGYNDIGFEKFIDARKPFKDTSGSYADLLFNSVLISNKRYGYLEALNYALEEANVDKVLHPFEAPNLAVYYLDNYLNRQGFNTRSINFYNTGKENLIKLLAQNPLSIIITTTYYTDKWPIKEIIKFIRKYNLEVKIIVGGPYIFSLYYDEEFFKECNQEIMNLYLKNLGADFYVVESQGEATLTQIIRKIKNGDNNYFDHIPNLLCRDQNHDFHFTNRQLERNDLNQNYIDWSQYKGQLNSSIAYVRTARGCAFKCSFCNYHIIAGKHTLMDLSNVEFELKRLHQCGIKTIIFVDDTFNVPKQRFKELLRMMIRNQFDFQWVSFFRMNESDMECYELMKESGCFGVLLGIESAAEAILKNMNKLSTLDKYKEGIEQLNKRGIITFGSFIVGFPGETEETVQTTIDFLNSYPTTFYFPQLYFHYKKAPIQQQADLFGIKGSGFNWQHNTMDWQIGIDMIKYFFSSIQYSIPLSTMNFSLWSLPYFVSKDISIELIKSFGRIMHQLLLKSFDDRPFDCDCYKQELIAIFQKR